MSVTSQNTTLGVNSANDLYVVNGQLVLLTGIDALAQSAVQYMKAQLGEMIFQPLDGLPNLTDVWLQQNLPKWEAAARATLSSVTGVTAIASFTYTVAYQEIDQQFELAYMAELNTIYGQPVSINQSIVMGNNTQ